MKPDFFNRISKKCQISRRFEFDRKIAETRIFGKNCGKNGKNKTHHAIHRTGAPTNLFLRCIAMNESAINWDEIPDVITKDHLYQICHISKSTAQYLLQSSKIPCEYSGKQTRCYKIKKADVIAYLEDRKVFPDSYSAPARWYSGHYTVSMKANVPLAVFEDMHGFYAKLLAKFPDVITAGDVSKLTGYGKTSVNNWCKAGHLKCFKRRNINHIPKVYLFDFFCSAYFRTITQKSNWHIKMLKRFPRWQKQNVAKGTDENT